MVKTIGSPRKINAIWFNIKINKPKLVIVCEYKFTTKLQNLTEIYLAQVKILQKGFSERATFLTHTVYECTAAYRNVIQQRPVLGRSSCASNCTC